MRYPKEGESFVPTPIDPKNVISFVGADGDWPLGAILVCDDGREGTVVKSENGRVLIELPGM